MKHVVTCLSVTMAGAAGWAAVPISFSTQPAAFPHDSGSWEQPLQAKAEILDRMAVERHNIDGLYPSQVTLRNGEADYTTAGHADISHSVNWTTYLFMSQVYRWKTTGDPEHLARAREVYEAIHRCHEVNGVPGLISRGYVLGHGPTYEERRGHGRGQDRWWQGEGEYAKYRWRGNPSHHNHSGFFLANGFAWLHLEDPAIRETVRADLEAVGRRVFLENRMDVVDIDGVVTAKLLGLRPPDRPTTRGLMVASELKILAVVTGDAAFSSEYDRIVEQLRFREFADRSVEDLVESLGHRDNDDADHCFNHLVILSEMEKDEELLRFYRKFAEALWSVHKDDRQPIYNMCYRLVTGKDARPEDIAWWLKYYPTIKVFQPRMNSIRPDIAVAPKPFPLSERPFDNEYDFKADPFRLDGWLSRIVTDVRVSLADPQVIFAADAGGFAYRSFDGGATWADAFRALGGSWVNAVLPSPQKTEIVLAATNRGLYRSRDAGYSWTLLLGGNASSLARHPSNPVSAFAVVDGQVLQAVAFDAYHWGMTWQPAGGSGPPTTPRRLWLLPNGDTLRLLAQDDRNVLWTSTPDADAWQVLDRPFGGRYAFTAVVGVGDTLAATAEGVRGTITVSTDGGSSWRPKGGSISWSEGSGGRLPDTDVQALAIDPNDPETIYVAGDTGLSASRDGGDTWNPAGDGLFIPAVRTLRADPATGAVYAGTPAGLFRSDDQGSTCQPTGLVPMFEGVQQIETGPADYLLAYWMARFHGFVTKEQATAPW